MAKAFFGTVLALLASRSVPVGSVLGEDAFDVPPEMSFLHTYTGSYDFVPNPERGFRHEFDNGCEGISEQQIQQLKLYNLTVAQTYCYIPNATELSQETLDSVSTAFGQLRDAGVKALWRFAYDRAMPGENRYTVETVLGHIAQLQPTFSQNLDALYVLQAGFLGSWGEWHSSQLNIEANATSTSAIVEAELFSLLPPDRKLNVRVPVYKLSGVLRREGAVDDRMGWGILDQEQSKRDTAVARVGYDNDGFMSTQGDGGTFGSTYTSRSWDPKAAKTAPFPIQGDALSSSLATPLYRTQHGGFIDPQYGYASRESAWLPVDGEMFWHAGHQQYDPKWPVVVAAETAAWRLREMHYSTLSLVHGYLDGIPTQMQNETIGSWMREELNTTLLGLYRLPISAGYSSVPHTGYEYIRDHLGYRLELVEASFPDRIQGTPGNPFVLEFSASLMNYGFAAPVNRRPVWVVLLSSNNQSLAWKSESSLADPTDWQPFLPGDPTFSVMLHTMGGSVKMVPAGAGSVASSSGRLALGLLLPDARSTTAAYSMRFANAQVEYIDLEGHGTVNVLGTVTLSEHQHLN